MILTATYGTVSDFEVLFTVIAAVGFCFSVITTRAAWRDYKDAKQIPERERNSDWWGGMMLARAWFFTEAGRIYLQFTFILLGTFQMTLPDAMLDLGSWRNVISLILRWMFLIAAAWTCAKTIYVYYIRYRLKENGRYLPKERNGTTA